MASALAKIQTVHFPNVSQMCYHLSQQTFVRKLKLGQFLKQVPEGLPTDVGSEILKQSIASPAGRTTVGTENYAHRINESDSRT
jgi:hypothetical protein